MAKKDISEFVTELSQTLQAKKTVRKLFIDIDQVPVSEGQFHYLFDIKNNAITHVVGFDKLFGYKNSDFNLQTYSSYIHPDDLDSVQRISVAAMKFATIKKITNSGVYNIAYRMRHADGHYIRVLRMGFPLDVDENDNILNNISIVKDINFLGDSTTVQWEFRNEGFDEDEFRQFVKAEHKNFFSKREEEILKLLVKGLTSQEVAEKINISKHTVDTHRRKMLEKSKTKNTIELLEFYKRNVL